jgi:cytidylate kinase
VPVITLSRQFGAGGAAVGRLLVERFGSECLDREVVFEAARRAGIPARLAAELDERAPGWLTRLSMALTAAYPEVIAPAAASETTVPGDEDRLAELTNEVIEEAAGRGNAVIVGRGGAFILRGRPGVLHVQLEASLEARIRYCREQAEGLAERLAAGETAEGELAQLREGLDDDSLGRLCRDVDAARGAYLRRRFGVDWRDPSHYHLVLDTGRLGFQTAAELIAIAAGRLAGSR